VSADGPGSLEGLSTDQALAGWTELEAGAGSLFEAAAITTGPTSVSASAPTATPQCQSGSELIRSWRTIASSVALGYDTDGDLEDAFAAEG
jgi:hypothetical protein